MTDEFESETDFLDQNDLPLSPGQEDPPDEWRREAVYFDAGELPEPRYSYVCWLDLMGIQSVMLESIHRAANQMFKLHSSVVRECDDGNFDIFLYPIMDGVYIVSESKRQLIEFLTEVFETLSKTMLRSAEEIYHVFAVKAAIAYGPVIHGRNVPEEADYELARYSNYKKSLLLGNPMIQAVQTESRAPPFGIYIHESARAFSPNSDHSDDIPFNQTWYRWYQPRYRDYNLTRLAEGLGNQLLNYFDWCKKHHHMFDHYNKDDMIRHREQVEQYFRKMDD